MKNKAPTGKRGPKETSWAESAPEGQVSGMVADDMRMRETLNSIAPSNPAAAGLQGPTRPGRSMTSMVSALAHWCSLPATTKAHDWFGLCQDMNETGEGAGLGMSMERSESAMGFGASAELPDIHGEY